MTKAGEFAVGASWDDIADFHLLIIDNDPIDEQFDELTALGEVQIGQSRLNALAEFLDADGRAARSICFWACASSWRSCCCSP